MKLDVPCQSWDAVVVAHVNNTVLLRLAFREQHIRGTQG